MAVFYRGDIVRCVNPNGVLSLSRLYAVMRTGRDITVVNDLGFEANYDADRFDLVEPVSRMQPDKG